jgi:hypothetical protein
MSTLPDALGPEYRLIDFDRQLQGTEGINIINSRYVKEPLPGWTVQHQISTETGTLEGHEVPTTRIVLYFYAAGDSKPAIVITCVHGSFQRPGWEMYARSAGPDVIGSASSARSLANRLIDGLLRETAARLGP